MAFGTRRSLSQSSRAARTCGTRRRAAAITSASAGSEGCVTMLAPGLVPPAGRWHAARPQFNQHAAGRQDMESRPRTQIPSTHVTNRKVGAPWAIDAKWGWRRPDRAVSRRFCAGNTLRVCIRTITAASTQDSLSHGRRWRKPMVGSLRREAEVQSKRADVTWCRLPRQIRSPSRHRTATAPPCAGADLSDRSAEFSCWAMA